MEHFVVSALKYRPQTFEDVVGQSAITNTLKNAIQNNHLAQALLFTGPRGVGKTTCARILAKMINSDGKANSSEDYAFNIFELDAASNNSVDDIRNLTDQVRIPPQTGHYKVYIIDEVHMLSQSAFNAFLKTLEEPPKHCIFILATTEKHKIIPTILSRCQIFDFKRISVTDAKNYLKKIADQQQVQVEDDALHIIAQKADGAMRDALSIFDRVVSFSGKNLTRQAVAQNLNVLDYDTFFESTDLIKANDIPALLVQFNKTLSKGFDGHHYITGLASHFRDLLVCKSPLTLELLEVGDQTKAQYQAQAQAVTQDFLIKAIDMANSCDLNYKTSKNQRLLVELCLMQIASITFDGEKKNDHNHIIPPTHFTSKPTPQNQVEGASNSTVAPIPTPEYTTVPVAEKKQKANEENEVLKAEEPKEDYKTPEPQPPIIKGSKTRTSGLSLSSIQKKKDHQIKQMDVVINEDDLPSESFTEENMKTLWVDYVKILETKGRYNLAAILQIDTPKLLDENTIGIEFPNTTNKIELERNQFELLQFLRKSLNNFKITLDISVNETLEKRYAYTSEEKYKKLYEKNNTIELLRKTFDLNL